jgi:hypothetical protein
MRTASRRLEEALLQTEHEHPNLVAVQRTVAECVMEIDAIDEERKGLHDDSDLQTTERKVALLRSSTDAISSRLATEPFKTLLREQKKWVDAGFSEEVVVTDPEAVHFTIATDLLYTILMYKKSSDVLEGREITIPIVNGKALFLVEGEYLPYAAIKGRIQYSDSEKKFLGWNFIHPAGFVPRDNTDFSEMYPIAQLKADAYTRIAHTASQFWSETQEEVDPGREKRYIFQVMTTGRCCIPRTWWGTNFDDMTPEHTSSRLITPDGRVFSFGTKMRASDAEHVTSLTNILTTAITLTSALDYEEPRSSDEKRVTSIPITQERFDAILRYVNVANKGFLFNFASQNCARFVGAQMRLAGVPVNIKMSVAQFVLGMVPNLKNVPLIGQPMSKLIAIVAFVATPIIDIVATVLRYITPYPVKRVWEVVTWAIREVFRRIGAIAINGLFYFVMGAGKSLVPPGRIKEEKQDPDDEIALPTSSCLMHWWDIFNPDAFFAYHAYKLKLWQYKQASSVFYTKPESGFYCIDPAKGVPPALSLA